MLLALMGMGSCENISPDRLGVNSVTYSVKGTVTDEKGNPIKTDAKGAYLLKVYGPSFSVVQVSVMDVDGIAHDGEFVSDSLRIRIFDFQNDTKMGWTADITVPDIKLKKK